MSTLLGIGGAPWLQLHLFYLPDSSQTQSSAQFLSQGLESTTRDNNNLSFSNKTCGDNTFKRALMRQMKSPWVVFHLRLKGNYSPIICWSDPLQTILAGITALHYFYNNNTQDSGCLKIPLNSTTLFDNRM